MHSSRKHWSSTPQATFRSGLEAKIAQQITSGGATFTFEQHRLAYVVPERQAKYTPDFVLPNGIIVETKGLFTTEDRQKMRLIKHQYPHLDIRFVFSNAKAKIAKKSPTTYAKWADTQGFKWAHRDIPLSWLTEPTITDKVASMFTALVPVN